MNVTITSPFSTATPESAMKPTAGRDRERHAAQPERDDAAGERQRHAA